MNNSLPPDHSARSQALDPTHSVLVQASAGSGKTTLLTQRYLALLSGVSDPSEIVAITFTNAAAAEMRHRILSELEKAERGDSNADQLAIQALRHAKMCGWKLLDQPTLLRVMTIDSFCRELALQQPLLSGFGGGLDISQHPDDLYRQAARNTLQLIDRGDARLRQAIIHLLGWRDNNWKDIEDQLVEMLAKRDRWMQGFVFDKEMSDQELRRMLEQPFETAVRASLERVSALLDQVPAVRDEALELARFACEQANCEHHCALAEIAEFPIAPFISRTEIDDAIQAHIGLADLLMTEEGRFRKQVDKRSGFPADQKVQKKKILQLIQCLRDVPGMERALADVRNLPPTRYTDEDWQIIRACFVVLQNAAAQLKTVFAEVGAVDFTEVAQIAQIVLNSDDGPVGEAAFSVSDNIHHLLVDEFQDTSRRQHKLLGSLIAHWPEREGRTAFVVGDPLQSIYFFRDADAELFPRVRDLGLDIPSSSPFQFISLQLTANFRTAPDLVMQFNESFQKIFSTDDGSGLRYTLAEPARTESDAVLPSFNLHMEFMPYSGRNRTKNPTEADQCKESRAAQVEEIVELCKSYQTNVEQARISGKRFRIAILGRSKNVLIPIAEALREARLAFRAIELESLSDRPEVLDALALARALLNPEDRVAWLGVLRAPWCGVDLRDLHTLTSADDPALQQQLIPQLISDRIYLLTAERQQAVRRVIEATEAATTLRATQPTVALGSWLEDVWLRLGGAACVDQTARANLDLLWSALDRLPAGEQDLLGPALPSALKKLNAKPDPTSSTQSGIQLMTIHKSKGLEFEVVLIPELQARSGRTESKMLSWLERGLTEEGDEATEFLVAPFQLKGTEGGKSKIWVDRVYREREYQEMRRLFYVATTRAREQLHLFARPEFKISKESAELELVEPKNSLLNTAWPALEQEVRSQFQIFRRSKSSENAHPIELDVAAAAEVISISAPEFGVQSNLEQHHPFESTGTMLRRLPTNFQPEPVKAIVHHTVESTSSSVLYTRQQGSVPARALGSAVHSLMEQLAQLRAGCGWDEAREALSQHLPRAQAQLRAAGISTTEATRLASEALEQALRSSQDPIGQWILDPHTDAASEVGWVGVLDGKLRHVQVDRVFRAGEIPGSLSSDENVWWIVDYKTSHTESADPTETLHHLRSLYAPQLEAYARILRLLQDAEIRIHAALYYPRLSGSGRSNFDWWLIEG